MFVMFLLCVIGNPLIRVIARHFSAVRSGSALKCFLLFSLNEFVSAIILATFSWGIMDSFTDYGTPLATRLLLRSVGHTIVFSATISYSAWFHHRLVTDLGIASHRATVGFLCWATYFPLLGRLMQSTASSVQQAIVYEMVATLVEIKTLDGLLKGMTPLHGIRSILTTFSCRKNPGETKREENRIQFCSDAIIFLSVSEAAALVICTGEVFFGRVNLGAMPGAPRKASSLSWANFLVMLIGELVVTDGTVGWLARRFKERYLIDPSLEWQRMKLRSQGFLAVSVICISGWSCVFIPAYFRTEGCYTAMVGAEEEWSLTSCPPIPTNISQMLRVDELYEEEWLTATGHFV